MIDFMVKLQEYRTPLLNKIVELITISAEEMTLIIFMCIVFWCISREHGYKLILSIIVASASNAVLKLIFKVERPWVKDSRIEPIRQSTATGYSMPSGHTQVGTSMWFSILRSFRKNWLTILGYTMMLLIAVSRVYLSVHTPQDVIAGLIFCVIGVLISHYLVDRAMENNTAVPFLVLAVIAIVGLFFVESETYYKMTGLLLALPIAFFLENKYIKFEAKTKWWKQLLKGIVGFAVVMIFKEGLKFILPEGLIFDALRYFFVGVAAVYLAPLVFVKLKLTQSKA